VNPSEITTNSCR